MLDVLRAGKSGLISWIFLAALIAVFAFVGPGSSAWSGGSGCAGVTSAYAAKVNGQPISLREYQDVERRVVDYQRQYFLQRMAGPEDVKNPTRMAELNRQAEEIARQMAPAAALEELVNRELVLQDAERRGLRISDAELEKAIAGDPRFQENGKYSAEQYKLVAKRQYGSEAALDEAMRKNLLYGAAMGVVESTVKVSESEVRSAWQKNADTVELSLVLFPKAAARAAATPTDAEVAAFAAKDAARIVKFYEDNLSRYDVPRQVSVRHLLFKTDGAGGKDGARKRAQDALARLKKGEDFAKLAAEVSDDANTKAQGGDLGTIRQGGAIEGAVADAALKLEKGQLSEPVESPAGLHVLRVDEVIPARKTPLADVKLDIARELLADDKQTALLKEKSDAALAAARGGQSLQTLFPAPPQAKAGEKVDDKNVVKLGDQPIVAQDFGPIPVSTTFAMLGTELLKDAAAAKTGDVLPKVYSLPQGLVVAAVKARRHPDESKYDAEREDALRSLRQAKSDATEKAWLKALRADAKVVTNADFLSGNARGGSLPVDD